MEGCLQYIFPIFILLMKTLMKLCVVRKAEDFHMISINYKYKDDFFLDCYKDIIKYNKTFFYTYIWILTLDNRLCLAAR